MTECYRTRFVDNLCHTLMGAALGGAGLRRHTRFASAALRIAANVPDVDVFVFATSVPPVSFRRGWTHGVIGQFVLPLVVTAVLLMFDRVRKPPPARSPAGPPIRAGWLLALSFIGLYSHLAMDFLNNYGVRLLAPLDWRWFYGDAVFIVDPWLWMVLGVSVWLARKGRRGPARWALGAAVAYMVVMLVSARLARDAVVDTWRQTHGTVPRALMVGPLPVTPLSRQVIVDAGDHYETGIFTWWPRTVVLDSVVIPKNDLAPESARARDLSPYVRGFLVWARFPFWTLEPDPHGVRVTVGDMRFGGRAGFSYSVVVQPLSE
jgi:inner membrane protein